MVSSTLTAIPPEALDSHVGVLGTSGAGKTYAAKGAAEQLLGRGRRVCVIDPTGVWWGLRLAADGKGEGFPVVIFGGDRADVPIDGTMGGRLAGLVAGGTFSCVIDVVRMTVGARTRFFAEFAEGLAQANRRPLHLVIDEAHLFAPQGGAVQDPISARMLGAANHLVSGGRALGLRVMLISQRPAKVHKDSLTQVQALVAMRMVAPQDRKAVKDWIGEWVEGGEKVLAALPAMPTGQGWVWAPMLNVLERAHFAPIATFDSSATPDADAEPAPAQLSALPLEELRAALVAEDTTAADAKPAQRASKGELEAAEQRGFDRGLALGRSEGERLEWRRQLERSHAEHMAALEKITRELARKVTSKESPASAGSPAATEKLSASAAKMLAVLRAPNLPEVARTWPAVAALAVLSPTGGNFNAARRQLLDGGHVHQRGGLLYAAVGRPETLPLDCADVAQAWCKKLRGSAARILGELYGRESTKAELARDLELSPTGGNWNAAWKTLRDNGLVEGGSGDLWWLAQPLRALKAGRS